jgi:glucan biosynthesis protein C
MVGDTRTRLFFVDYLRAAIVTLVILHHVAVVYAANIPFYYLEPTSDTLSIIVLVIFELFNQAWFMGFFFLLSGYFTSSSYDRKGPRLFLKDRLIRLGIPLLIVTFLLEPLTFFIGVPHISPTLLEKAGISLPLTWNDYVRFIGFGWMWFVAMLLLFDISYATWRVASKKRQARKEGVPRNITYLSVAVFILVLAAASYLLRIVVPLGQSILYFPTIAYLPEYISFFLIGVIASRKDWLRRLSSSMAKRFFFVGIIVSLILFPLSLAEGYFLGNGSWQSGIYALWDSTFAVGMSMGIIVLFRRFYDRQGRLYRLFSQHSYTVYVIHLTLIIALAALVLSSISLMPLLKFGLAAVIAVPLCWGAAYLIRKIPFVSKVL